MQVSISHAIGNNQDVHAPQEQAAKVVVEPLTYVDIESVVDVHMEAYHDRPSGMVGRKYARQFLLWFSHQPDAVAIVAKHGDKVLGYGVGAPVGYQRRLNRNLFWTVFWSVLFRPKVWINPIVISNIWSRFLVLLGVSPKESRPPDLPLPLMSYVGAAVSSEARGMGVGFALYKSFEDETRKLGTVKSIRGTVHRDNAAPAKILSKLGWTPWRENKLGYISWFKSL